MVCFVNLGLARLTKHDIDLSFAHGLVGILLLVLNAYPILDDKKAARKMVEEGIRFIMAHELPIRFADNEFSMYPCSFRDDSVEIKRFNRLGWCYGDINFVLLLYRAAKVLNKPPYNELADKIGAQTVLRKNEKSTMVSDSHLCHGSSGLILVYDTLYQQSGLSIYSEAKKFWYEETLKMVRSELTSDKYSVNPVSLLEGWPGVSLTLASVDDKSNSFWRELFLL